MTGPGIGMAHHPPAGRTTHATGQRNRRRTSYKGDGRGGKNASNAAIARQRIQCAPLCENPSMLNVQGAQIRHALPRKPSVSPPLADVKQASVTVRENSPNDSGILPAKPAALNTPRVVSGSSVGMRFVSGPISDVIVIPSPPVAPPVLPKTQESAPAEPRPAHQLPVKPITPTLPVERDARVGIDVHLSGDLAVEGGCVHGIVRLGVPDHKSPASAMLLAQPRVRIIGYESLPGEDTRHVFYHHASVLDSDRSVDGPSEPYVLQGPAGQNEEEQMLPCYASLPDSDGYYLGKGGDYELPFTLTLPIGRGARGSFRSSRAQVGYLVIASVRVKSFGEQHGRVAHSFSPVDLHPYINPTAALASAARPILARNVLPGGNSIVDLAAALHRETWVAGQRVYFDVSVRNNSEADLERLGVALVRCECIHRNNGEEKFESVIAAEKLDAHGNSPQWWQGVGPNAVQHFSHTFVIPEHTLSIMRGKHLGVHHYLRISIGSGEHTSAQVDVPLRVVHYASIDPPPMKRNLAQCAGLFPSTFAAPQDPSQMIERVRSLEALRSPRATMSLSGHLVPEPPRARTAQHRRSLDFINHAIRSATARHGSPCTQEELPMGLGIQISDDVSNEAPEPTRPAYNPGLPVLELPECSEEADSSQSLVLGDETCDDVGLALDDRRDGDGTVSESWSGIIDAYYRAGESSTGHIDIDDAPPSREATPTLGADVSTPRTQDTGCQSAQQSTPPHKLPHQQSRDGPSALSVPTTPAKTAISPPSATHFATAPRVLESRRSGFFVATSDSPVRVKAKVSCNFDQPSAPHDQRLKHSQSTTTLRPSTPRFAPSTSTERSNTNVPKEAGTRARVIRVRP